MADDDDAASLDDSGQVAQEESEATLTPTAVEENPLDPPKYKVRPGLGEKFQAQAVQDIILTSMQEQLMGRQYRSDQASKWAKSISNGVRQRVQGLGMKRYKIIVHTTVLEMKGAGVMSAQRCIWDPETDAYINDSYRNDSMLCHTIVYGIYLY